MKYASKKQFVDRIEREHATFVELAESIPRTRRAETGVWGEDWTLKDLLAHLTEWEQLFLSWFRQGLAGETPTLPAAGYKWNELSRLNRDIWKKHRRTSWERVREQFDASYDEILALTKKLRERELLTPRQYEWTKTYPLTTYLGANTCSHYAAATKIVKKWWRGQQ